jgi:uncharacterized protein YhfF
MTQRTNQHKGEGMEDSKKVTLVGNFKIVFENDDDARKFIELIQVQGNIDYRAYADFYGESKMFQEASYRGRLDD